MANTLTGFFTLFLSFFMIATSVKSPLSVDDHIYVEGKIFNVVTHKAPKRTTYQSFKIKHSYYKGKIFENHPLMKISDSGVKVSDYFKENAIIGFHVEKGTYDDMKIKIYSLKSKDKFVIPLQRKWIYKYWNLGIGIFLLIGSYFIFINN